MFSGKGCVPYTTPPWEIISNRRVNKEVETCVHKLSAWALFLIVSNTSPCATQIIAGEMEVPIANKILRVVTLWLASQVHRSYAKVHTKRYTDRPKTRKQGEKPPAWIAAILVGGFALIVIAFWVLKYRNLKSERAKSGNTEPVKLLDIFRNEKLVEGNSNKKLVTLEDGMMKIVDDRRPGRGVGGMV